MIIFESLLQTKGKPVTVALCIDVFSTKNIISSHNQYPNRLTWSSFWKI